jgi:glycosyltransferase involved in cell wall biosynthesis
MSQNRPIRLLLAVTSPLSLLMIAGQPAFFHQHGIATSVASGDGPMLAEFAAREGIEVLELPWQRGIAPLSDLVALWRLWRWLRRVRPSIISSGTPKAGLIGSLAGILARVPCRIYVLHGLRYETFAGLRRAVLFAADWISCRCCHRVHCVSDSVRDVAIAAGITSPQQSVVIADGTSNGIDVSRFEPTPALLAQAAAVRRDLAIPEDAPILGFVGRLAGDKGIHELLHAFQKLVAAVPNLRLLMLGDPDPVDPLDESDLRLLREHPNIVCTGFVADTETYYRMMDIFVLPTHREGFPSTVLEAQASGKPVVTTTATGAIDSIVHEVTGILVPPRNAEALRAALERLLLDRASATRMGSAGRERVLRFFQREQVWRWFVNEYRALLAARGLALPSAQGSGAADEGERVPLSSGEGVR